MRRLWIQSFENYSCVAANSHLVAIGLCDHPFEWSPVKSYPTLLLDGKTGDVRGEFPSAYGRGMQTHFGIPKSERLALGRRLL